MVIAFVEFDSFTLLIGRLTIGSRWLPFLNGYSGLDDRVFADVSAYCLECRENKQSRDYSSVLTVRDVVPRRFLIGIGHELEARLFFHYLA